MKKELVDQMTLQEAFDFAVTKIVEQGCRAMMDAGHRCAYLNSEGHRCAASWLLDETNKRMMKENVRVTDLVHEYEDDVPKLMLNNSLAFDYLQLFHDQPYSHERIIISNELTERFDIDTTGKPWKDWIEMGG